MMCYLKICWPCLTLEEFSQDSENDFIDNSINIVRFDLLFRGKNEAC